MVDVLLRHRNRATDPRTASGLIRSALGAGEVTAGDGPFAFDQLSLVDDGITVSRFVSSGTDVRLRVDRSPDLGVVAVRGGRVALTCDDEAVVLEPDGLGLLPLGGSVELAWTDARFDLFSFPLSSLVRLLHAEPPLRLHAPRLTPTSRAVGVFWDRLAALLAVRMLGEEEVYTRDLLRGQLIDALTATTVEAFELSDRTAEDEDRDGTVLRRAGDHMRQHLGDPISIPDVAAAAGVSVRGLQVIFQRRLGETPLAHLRRLRLEAAREDLQRGAPGGLTVTQVARRYGYTNVGRFGAHYRDEFDEPPSVTLQRLPASA